MWGKVVAVVQFAVLANHLLQLYFFFGFNKQLHNHKPGPCKIVPGIDDGSEDLTTLPDGLTFITSGLREYATGRLYVFHFNKAENGVTELQITGEFNDTGFHPHGLSVWEDNETGDITLFVINHAPERDHVEVFKYSRKSPTKLLYVKTITDDTFRFCNDLVATGSDTFYITNYFWWRPPLNVLESFLLLRWGTVVYYDGSAGTMVLHGLLIPNGINLSPDKKYLYIAEVGAGDLRVYRRDSNTQLANIQTLQMYSGIDNIEVEPQTGDLWIGAHLSLWKISAQDIIDKTKVIPSQVFRLKTRDGLVKDVTEVYADRGSELSGSSVATHYKRQILVGTVGHKLLYCKLQLENP